MIRSLYYSVLAVQSTSLSLNTLIRLRKYIYRAKVLYNLFKGKVKFSYYLFLYIFSIRTILLQYLNHETAAVNENKVKTIEGLDISNDDPNDAPNSKSKLKDPDFVPSKHVKLVKPKGKFKQKSSKNGKTNWKNNCPC